MRIYKQLMVAKGGEDIFFSEAATAKVAVHL